MEMHAAITQGRKYGYVSQNSARNARGQRLAGVENTPPTAGLRRKPLGRCTAVAVKDIPKRAPQVPYHRHECEPSVAVGLVRYLSHHALCDTDIAIEGPFGAASEDECPVCLGQAKPQHGQREPQEASHHDRLPPKTIRGAAPLEYTDRLRGIEGRFLAPELASTRLRRL